MNEEISLALSSQDEIDKKDVSLYGMKGNNEKQQNHQLKHYNSNTSSLGKTEGKANDGKNTTQNNSGAEPVIQLHKPCLNCAQPTSMILDLYKVACLAYAPSSVSLNGLQQTRRSCLD